MLRKFFRKYLPSNESIRQNRHIARFGTLLLHPNLWHLNRKSVAGGTAVGLFCGLVPGPLQMLSAALLAILFRVNLPVSVIVTWYTNPQGWADWANGNLPRELGVVHAGEVVLFHSETLRSGSVYHPMKRLPLGGA